MALANLGAIDLVSGDTTLRPRTIRGGMSHHALGWPFFFCQAVGVGGLVTLTFIYPDPDISDALAREYIDAVSHRLAAFVVTDGA